jgi:hypothetical protein
MKKNTVISGLVCVFLALSAVAAYGQEEEAQEPLSNVHFGFEMHPTLWGGYRSVGGWDGGTNVKLGLGFGAYNFGLNVFGEIGYGLMGSGIGKGHKWYDIFFWNFGASTEIYYFKILGIGGGVGFRNLNEFYIRANLFTFLGEDGTIGLYGTYFPDDSSFGIGVQIARGASAYKKSQVSVFAIPAGTITIPDRAYYGKTYRTISIPATVTTVGNSAFASNQLERIPVLPAGLTTIGAGAFTNNRMAGSLTFPAGITDIGDSAFESNLISSVTIPASISYIRPRTFRNNRIQNLVIPATVERIGAYAFSDNRISELTIAEGVTTIDNYAFVYNRSLKTVHIPESVTSLGQFAFDPGVTITGNEQFRRSVRESYFRISVRQTNNGNTNFNGKIDGQTISAGTYYIFPKESGHSIISVNEIGPFKDFPFMYTFQPGHEYEFECYSMHLGYYLRNITFFVLDKTTNRGGIYEYNWQAGMESLIDIIVRQQLLARN